MRFPPCSRRSALERTNLPNRTPQASRRARRAADNQRSSPPPPARTRRQPNSCLARPRRSRRSEPGKCRSRSPGRNSRALQPEARTRRFQSRADQSGCRSPPRRRPQPRLRRFRRSPHHSHRSVRRSLRLSLRLPRLLLPETHRHPRHRRAPALQPGHRRLALRFRSPHCEPPPWHPIHPYLPRSPRRPQSSCPRSSTHRS